MLTNHEVGLCLAVHPSFVMSSVNLCTVSSFTIFHHFNCLDHSLLCKATPNFIAFNFLGLLNQYGLNLNSVYFVACLGWLLSVLVKGRVEDALTVLMQIRDQDSVRIRTILINCRVMVLIHR